MRGILLILFILGVLAGDWVALHDIIKAEPDPWMEGAFVVASLALFVVFGYRRLPESKRA